MPDSRLHLLGSFELRTPAAAAAPSLPRKLLGLLAVLALRQGEDVSRDHLASLLWGGSSTELARQSLRQALIRLRGLLPAEVGGALRASPRHASLEAGGIAVDAREFEAALQANGVADLRQAVALYRGDLLQEFVLGEPAFDKWLSGERMRLRLRFLQAGEALIEAEARQLNHAGAIEAAQRLVACDPAHEPAHRALMRAYAAQGRRDMALRQFQLCGEALRRALQVSPDQATHALHDEIRNGAAPAARPGRGVVLVVEDEPVTRALLQGLLDEAGYEAVAAADGADALFLLGRRRFDLVVSDLRMPLLDGFQLLQIVREKGPRTPVIIVAGGAEQQARVLAAGAEAYIPKPLVRDAFLRQVARAIQAKPHG